MDDKLKSGTTKNEVSSEAPKKDEFKTLTEAEAMAYLEEVDKESQTRNLTGIIKQFFYFACIAVSLYHLYTSFAGTYRVCLDEFAYRDTGNTCCGRICHQGQ